MDAQIFVGQHPVLATAARKHVALGRLVYQLAKPVLHLEHTRLCERTTYTHQ